MSLPFRCSFPKISNLFIKNSLSKCYFAFKPYVSRSITVHLLFWLNFQNLRGSILFVMGKHLLLEKIPGGNEKCFAGVIQFFWYFQIYWFGTTETQPKWVGQIASKFPWGYCFPWIPLKMRNAKLQWSLENQKYNISRTFLTTEFF